MECQNRSDKYIWSPHDAYFYKGLSELIVDIDRLIYLSLEKIRKDFVFINLNTDSLSEFINRDNEWLSAVKGKQVVLIAARKSEALANYWYYNSNIRGVVYAGLSRDIRKELVYVINGRFLRKDIKKDITKCFEKYFRTILKCFNYYPFVNCSYWTNWCLGW